MAGRVWRTGFTVGATDLRFGILVPSGSAALIDWERESRIVEFPGLGGLTEIQRLGFGPRRVTYRVYLESRDDLRTLDSLIQQTGTLTIYAPAHSLPASGTANRTTHGKRYTDVATVLLYALANRALFVGGSCEVDATFVQVAS